MSNFYTILRNLDEWKEELDKILQLLENELKNDYFAGQILVLNFLKI